MFHNVSEVIVFMKDCFSKLILHILINIHNKISSSSSRFWRIFLTWITLYYAHWRKILRKKYCWYYVLVCLLDCCCCCWFFGWNISWTACWIFILRITCLVSKLFSSLLRLLWSCTSPHFVIRARLINYSSSQHLILK